MAVHLTSSVSFLLGQRRASSVSWTPPLARVGARGAQERPTLISRCALTLIAVELLTDILSGLFGVVGGFIIVPALVVITLVSVSGMFSYLMAGRSLDLMLTSLFVAGGIAGMSLGTGWSRRLSGPKLQRGFAVALVVVAAFVITRNLR